MLSCLQMRRAGGSGSGAGNAVSNPSMMGMNPMMMGMMGQARFKPYALCLLGAELKPSAMPAPIFPDCVTFEDLHLRPCM